MTSDLTPYASEVSALLDGLSSVDVSDLLSHVVFSIFLRVHTLDSDERMVRMLISLASLESEDGTLSVKADGLLVTVGLDSARHGQIDYGNSGSERPRGRLGQFKVFAFKA